MRVRRRWLLAAVLIGLITVAAPAAADHILDGRASYSRFARSRRGVPIPNPCLASPSHSASHDYRDVAKVEASMTWRLDASCGR